MDIVDSDSQRARVALVTICDNDVKDHTRLVCDSQWDKTTKEGGDIV
jgi:hypothetical protein